MKIVLTAKDLVPHVSYSQFGLNDSEKKEVYIKDVLKVCNECLNLNLDSMDKFEIVMPSAEDIKEYFPEYYQGLVKYLEQQPKVCMSLLEMIGQYGNKLYMFQNTYLVTFIKSVKNIMPDSYSMVGPKCDEIINFMEKHGIAYRIANEGNSIYAEGTVSYIDDIVRELNGIPLSIIK